MAKLQDPLFVAFLEWAKSESQSKSQSGTIDTHRGHHSGLPLCLGCCTGAVGKLGRTSWSFWGVEDWCSMNHLGVSWLEHSRSLKKKIGSWVGHSGFKMGVGFWNGLHLLIAMSKGIAINHSSIRAFPPKKIRLKPKFWIFLNTFMCIRWFHTFETWKP